LTPGVEGLAHISELSDRRIKKCSEVLEVGQQVQARVLKLDTDQRRISLSLKTADAEATPEEIAEAQKPHEPPKKQRKKFLRGGLEGGWDWQGGRI